MPTNTAPASPPARQDPRQVANTLVRTVNYNDPDVTGATFANSLPGSARIITTQVEVVTPFNAATTNTLVVGTNSTNYNNIVPITAVNLTATGVTNVNSGNGVGPAGSNGAAVNAIYSQTGTSATAGKAVITIVFEGGNLS